MTDQPSMTVRELLHRIETGWNTFYAYLDTLSEAQFTGPKDAAGWTAKDHLSHIAFWEDTLNALLERTPRWERLGIDKALWDTGDVDKFNAVMQAREKDVPLAEVRRKHRDVHQRLLANLAALSDADLGRPIREFQAASTSDRPILLPLMGDTFEAYEEHTPWIRAIVGV